MDSMQPVKEAIALAVAASLRDASTSLIERRLQKIDNWQAHRTFEMRIESRLALNPYAAEMPASGSGFCRCNTTFILTNKLVCLVTIAVIGGSLTLFVQKKPANVTRVQ